MTIPDSSHEAWGKILSGETECTFEHLATRLLVSRLHLRYLRDSNPELTQRSVKELRDFFVRNERLPKVKADLGRIFVEGG